MLCCEYNGNDCNITTLIPEHIMEFSKILSALLWFEMLLSLDMLSKLFFGWNYSNNIFFKYKADINERNLEFRFLLDIKCYIEEFYIICSTINFYFRFANEPRVLY